MCELLTTYFCSVRVSRYDLLTRESMITFTILGLLLVCVIINSYETVIQISIYHLQVDAFQIWNNSNSLPEVCIWHTEELFHRLQ